jgi:hypothetical protein
LFPHNLRILPMADLSNYLETALYNHVLRNTSYTPPATVYAALFSAVTDAEAGTGTELASTGYTRQAVTMAAPTDGAGSNSAVVTFGPITSGGAGQTVSHIGLFDALTGGNCLFVIKPLVGGTVTFREGDSIQLPVGQLIASFA